MLVGSRLGIKIEGCHFPGHFLARINLGGKKVFVDCFNGGYLIEEKDLLTIKDETFKGMTKVLHEKSDTLMMVRAFLANLIRSYQVKEDEVNSEFLIGLFDSMDRHASRKKTSELTPEDIINFTDLSFNPGQCIRHKRYGYRGIIVDVDLDCTATDSWYYANQTQPSRYQPWYHVLVHASDQVTYVAENNLIKDRSNASVTHSLLSYFFTKANDGSYIRNDNIWPGTDF
jgi:heat shock protein HspQ